MVALGRARRPGLDTALDLNSESRYCLHCKFPYQWRKSTSWSLKLQFCSMTCERSENGCTIEDILSVERFGFPISEVVGRVTSERELQPV